MDSAQIVFLGEVNVANLFWFPPDDAPPLNCLLWQPSVLFLRVMEKCCVRINLTVVEHGGPKADSGMDCRILLLDGAVLVLFPC